MDKTHDKNIDFKKAFSMYATAETNLRLNGYDTTHEKDEIVISRNEEIIGKLVHDPEKNIPALYLNKKSQGNELNTAKMNLVVLLSDIGFPAKPVDF